MTLRSLLPIAVAALALPLAAQEAQKSKSPARPDAPTVAEAALPRAAQKAPAGAAPPAAGEQAPPSGTANAPPATGDQAASAAAEQAPPAAGQTAANQAIPSGVGQATPPAGEQTAPAAGQAAAAPAGQAAPLAAAEAAPPAPSQATPQAAAEAVPPAAAEQKLTGTVEVGYRFVQDVAGSKNTYRSIVNLGEGPKLFRANTSFRDPNGKFLDRLELQATSWGGDPYNAARLEAGLSGIYLLQVNYSNVAYFNAMPSFADPLLGQGLVLNERALDLQRRQIDTELDIKPGARFSPFLAFSQNSGHGHGITTFVSDSNEFPVNTNLGDSTESYRGGAHLNFSRFNVTLEQGGTTFKNDQQVYTQTPGGLGNRTTSGLVLNSLYQAYGARGSGIFDRGVIQARPWSWLNFTGQYLYSEPSIDAQYFDQAKGNLLLQSALAPYTGLSEISMGQASRPHTSGSWSAELRPFRRLRIVESWFTDRFHISGSSVLAQNFNTTPPTNVQLQVLDDVVMNYNQHQVEALLDLGSFLTLRGGERYVWGDAEAPNPLISRTSGPVQLGEVRRQVALAGASLRFSPKLDLSLDFEASPGDRVFFRTDLMRYQRARVRGRYRFRPSLTLTASFSILNNQNPAPDVLLDFRSQQSSLSVTWTPNKAKRFTVIADYSRSTLRSDVPFLEPETLQTDISRYRDNAHLGGVFVETNFSRGGRLSLGGSYSIDNGSRPTRYYQPQARFALPLRGKIAWASEWRWFGFTESRYAFENFHTHMFSTGLQIGL